MLAGRLPANIHLIIAGRDRFLPAAEIVRLGGEGLPARHRAAAAEPYGAGRLRAPLRHELSGRAGGIAALLQRGLVLRRLSEPADAFGVWGAARSEFRYLYDVHRGNDRASAARAAGILAVMGLADEFTAEMARFVTGDADGGGAARRADRAERLCTSVCRTA